MHLHDGEAAATGKNRGVCIYVNNTGCTVSVGSDCSADFEYLIIKCRPLYLLCEFTCVVIAVHVPLDAKANIAMKELSAAINNMQTGHPDGVFNVSRNFNHCNIRSVLPNFQ